MTDHRPVRRIVTGHDADGRAIIQSDAPVAFVRRVGGAIGPLFHEVWSTYDTPAPIDAASEPDETTLTLAPPPRGTRLRVLDIPPEGDEIRTMSPEAARAHFAEIGAVEAAGHGDGPARHALMHRTETIDYGIVLEGELTLIMDEGETVVRAGDIVVQRGTNHGWSNRSDANCRVAFVLVDGEYAPDLRR
ncbi:cupin domain-containing protein [Sphingomonas sp. Y38-1Y]|jgi:mannose-6-phosphate isomerase-like protein (cupin superfamily)|uniref:cupin domain-containing protein n=1 Tax=Sphingomonas sp. Y38-1Y TaxID=3078265 RepID=UPI0028E2986A|nr:cupin domain-containing protein [Sphingomonas sp. Y38-1Y]